LERYRLDQFLNPQYWLAEDEGPPRTAVAPKLLTDLEREVEDAVRAEGADRGIVVERVELGMIRPAEESISRQWLEFWQAKLQKSVDRYTMEAQTTHAQWAQDAQLEAQVAFVNRVLEELQQLSRDDVAVPPQLIIAAIVEAFHAMSDRGPEAQRLLVSQNDDLMRAIGTVRGEEMAPLQVDDEDTTRLLPQGRAQE
jgi:hypothetical protein